MTLANSPDTPNPRSGPGANLRAWHDLEFGHALHHPYVQALLAYGFELEPETRPQCEACRRRKFGPRIPNPDEPGTYDIACLHCGELTHYRRRIWHRLTPPGLPAELQRLVVPLALSIGKGFNVVGREPRFDDFEELIALCKSAEALLAHALSVADGLTPPRPGSGPRR